MTGRFRIVACAIAFAGCGGSPLAGGAATGAHATPTEAGGNRPARYLLMSGVGVIADEGAVVERPRDFVLLGGRRAIVERGVIREVIEAPSDLEGFRSVPAGLGGGVVLWSAEATYYAARFEADLQPIAPVGASGGARPWFGGMLLRTSAGLYVLDVASRKVTRFDGPTLADAMATGGGRAVRLDPWGRLELTVDGRAWRPPPTPVIASSLEEKEGGVLVQGGVAAWLGADATGLTSPPPEPPPDAWARPTTRPFADEWTRTATISGALDATGRVVVFTDGGLALLEGATGAFASQTLNAPANPSGDACQTVRSDGDLLLVCTHGRGAHVVRFEGDDPESPRLEATFPLPGVFVGRDDGPLAYEGRCGSDVPTADDFVPLPSEVEEAPPAEGETAPAEGEEKPLPTDREAHLCVRATRDRWVELAVAGDGVARLYRWIPAPDGEAVAIVLTERGEVGAIDASEGVHVVRVDLGDRKEAFFPDRRTGSFPQRQVEDDYWVDDNGAIRGWVEMGGSEEGEAEILTRGPVPRRLPVTPSTGGPAAGVTIGLDGTIALHPPPPDITGVVRGGRFAVATGGEPDAPRTFETLDGGRTWRPTASPPVGGLVEGVASPDVAGCSAIGCSWGSGVVRWGWGGAPAARAQAAAEASPPAARRPPRIALACGAPPGGEAATSPAIHLVTAQVTSSFASAVRDPFTPRGRSRHLGGGLGAVPATTAVWIPTAPTAPFGVAVVGADGAMISPDRKKAAQLGLGDGVTAVTDAGAGALLAYGAGTGALVLSRADRVVTMREWPLLADVRSARTTLARGSDGRLGIAGYSSLSGDVWVAPFDVGRIRLESAIGLASLDRAQAWGEGACAAPAGDRWRFVAWLPLRLGGTPEETVREGLFSLSASATEICVEGAEVELDSPSSVLVARFAGNREAAWIAGDATPTDCSLSVSAAP